MIGEKWIKNFKESMSYIDPLLNMQDLGAALLLRFTNNKKLSYSVIKGGKQVASDSLANKYFGRQSVKALAESPFMDSVVEDIIHSFAKENSLTFQRAVMGASDKLMAAKAEIDDIESVGLSPADLKNAIEDVIRDASKKKDYDLMLKAIDKMDKLFPVDAKHEDNTHIMILPPKNNTICPHCNKECIIMEEKR